MNITFMIGNGFDLALGLNTKYKDFLNYYLKLPKNDELKSFSSGISPSEPHWSDLEVALGKYTSQFNKDEMRLFQDGLDDLSMQLAKYIQTQQDRVQYTAPDKIVSSLFSSFFSFQNLLPVESKNIILEYLHQHRTENRNINIIDFNYTTILDRCFAFSQEISVPNKTPVTLGKVVHIHGTTEQSLIMGVNDESQISNTDFCSSRRFLMQMVKKEANQALRNNLINTCSSLIDQSQLICIYGMALGSTDRMWWDKVTLWLANHSSCHLIIFSHSDSYSQTLPSGYMDERLRIEDLLLAEKSELFVSQILSRIHIAVNQNPIQLKGLQISAEKNTSDFALAK